MEPSQYEALTTGTGAQYQRVAVCPRYELLGLVVVYGSQYNDFIKVTVKDAAGKDSFGTWVRHSFGAGGPDETERFPYTGTPVQFNLGPGSHFNYGDPPPDRITVEGAASDMVLLGNCSTIDFTHTQWELVFKRIETATVPVTPPETLPPPIGTARDQAIAGHLDAISAILKGP